MIVQQFRNSQKGSILMEFGCYWSFWVFCVNFVNYAVVDVECWLWRSNMLMLLQWRSLSSKELIANRKPPLLELSKYVSFDFQSWWVMLFCKRYATLAFRLTS
jgi:hypothetical protein